jgi:hypothetical protein
MKNKAEFMARHPVLMGAICAVIAGLCGWNAFQTGVKFAELRVMVEGDARAISEALGG